MERKVRVRFAPSPTGALHLGGVRTALFNYLFARQGDCGPYRQSERKEIYREYALRLVESGHAYYAFDTAEELDALRKECESRGETFIYNAAHRGSLKNSLVMPADEVQRLLDSQAHYVIRFKMPENEDLLLHDIIRGEVHFNSSLLDDKVLYKSDGMPTYHLANIVDDHLMRITHVIRGEEWLPSLPLHVLLYRAFGWEETMPEFAHLPLILKPVGNGKLSKRDGNKMGFPVFPMEFTDPATGEKWHGYKEDGYFPEAFINMLALLGWNPGTDQEIFTLQELCDLFTLDRVEIRRKVRPGEDQMVQSQIPHRQARQRAGRTRAPLFGSRRLALRAEEGGTHLRPHERAVQFCERPLRGFVSSSPPPRSLWRRTPRNIGRKGQRN